MTKLLYYKRLEEEISKIQKRCDDLKAINDLLMNNCGKTFSIFYNSAHLKYKSSGLIYLEVLNDLNLVLDSKQFYFANKIFSKKELKYFSKENGNFVYNNVQANSYNEFINRVSNYIGKTLDAYMARLKAIYKKLGVQEEVK